MTDYGPDDIIPAEYVFGPRYRDSVDSRRQSQKQSEAGQNGQRGQRQHQSVHQSQFSERMSRYRQDPNYQLLNDEHYQMVELYKVLYLSGRKKSKETPRKQNYCTMLTNICCPVWKFLSFTTICLVVYIGVFIAQAVNGIVETGTLLQIQIDVIILMGGNKPIFVRQGEVWRLFVASVLHVDFNHLLGNFVLTLMLLSHVEYTIGHFRCLVIYIITAFGANIFTALLAPLAVKAGASTCLFGLLGFTLGYIIVNWRGLNIIGKILKCQVIYMTFMIIVFIGVLTSIGQNIDYFGHLGGFLTGIGCTGIVKPINNGKLQKGLRIFFTTLLVAQLVVTFTLFYTIPEEELFKAQESKL